MKAFLSLLRGMALATAIVSSLPASAFACDNPVFRYALQNWAAADFDLLLVKRRDLTPEETAAWEQLQRAVAQNKPRLNLKLKLVTNAELQGSADPALKALAGASAENLLVLVAPEAAPTQSRLVWSGPCTAESATRLVDSPARRQLATRLLDGEAVVWIILQSSQTQQNRELLATLETFLVGYSETVAAADALAAEEAANRPANSASPPSTTPPVDKSVFWPPRFSSIEVTPDDPQEIVLVSMLKRLVATPPGDEPLLFAVFGQCRVLGGMPASQVNLASLGSACDFLTGACSCEVKDRNPGDDLLMMADWSSVAVNAESSGTITFLSLDAEVPAEPPAIPPAQSPENESTSPVPTTSQVTAADQSVPSDTESAPPDVEEPGEPDARKIGSAPPPRSWQWGVLSGGLLALVIGYLALRKSS